MSVEGDFRAGRILLSSHTKDGGRSGVKHPSINQVSYGSAGLERWVEGKPRLGPEETAFYLRLDLGPNLIVLNVEESLYEGFVVVEDLPEDTERVHDDSPFPCPK
jgi:hypothetical protein